LERITSLRIKETTKAKLDLHKGSDSHDELLLIFLNYFDMTGVNPRQYTAHPIEETRKLADRVINIIKGIEKTTDDKLREILNTVKSEGYLRSPPISQPAEESLTAEELQQYIAINEGHAAKLEKKDKKLSLLEKELADYQRKLRELESNGGKKQVKDSLPSLDQLAPGRFFQRPGVASSTKCWSGSLK